jgi:predicted ATP-binding protein involved in virulence
MTTKLTKLKLDNVGGFKDFELNFHENLTILIGKNGAGKTTILRSIAFLLDMALDTLLELVKNPYFNKKNFVLQKLLKHEARVLLPESSNYSISIESSIDGKTFSLTGDSSEGFDSFFEILQDFYNNQQYLPLFIYYPSYNAPIGNIQFSDLKLENHIYAAYIFACQEGVFDFNRFFIWFKWQENIQREVGRNKKYEMVRKVICKVISDEQNIFDNLHVTWQQNPNGDLCIEKNGILLNINQLSAGEKMLMILVADLARRLIVANPKNDNPLRGEGVILIDEIDLHLHPSWQRAVVLNLTKNFPNCQFIITTHSPVILAEVKPENIIILKDFKALQNTQHTFGRDTNSILLDIMDVLNRPKKVQEKLQECFAHIDNDKLQKAEQELEKLEAHLGPNDPDVVYIHSLLSFYQE